MVAFNQYPKTWSIVYSIHISYTESLKSSQEASRDCFSDIGDPHTFVENLEYLIDFWRNHKLFLNVGLQEVEMGAGFLAMSAAKETIGVEGSSNGQWWQDAIEKAMGEGSTFERVGSRQLVGLLIAIWVRKSLRTHVGDHDVGAVACGLGRTFDLRLKRDIGEFSTKDEFVVLLTVFRHFASKEILVFNFMVFK